MAKIISISNFKGGCGKTTTTQSLAAALALKGNNCLVVDLDPQANLTLVSDVSTDEGNIYDIMCGKSSVEQICHINKYYDIIPADISLSKADITFTGEGKEFILKNILDPLREKYDYILLDTAPTLNILTINSLTASDYVIIPTEQSFYAIQCLDQLYDTIIEVKKKYNKNLSILGLLLVRSSEKASINRLLSASIDKFAKVKKIRIFNTKIREGSVVAIAQVLQKSIIDITPSKNPTKDYIKLADEVDPEYTFNVISNIS